MPGSGVALANAEYVKKQLDKLLKETVPDSLYPMLECSVGHIHPDVIDDYLGKFDQRGTMRDGSAYSIEIKIKDSNELATSQVQHFLTRIKEAMLFTLRKNQIFGRSNEEMQQAENDTRLVSHMTSQQDQIVFLTLPFGNSGSADTFNVVQWAIERLKAEAPSNPPPVVSGVVNSQRLDISCVEPLVGKT